MTDEIIKLYENAGIKPFVRDNAIGRGYYIEHQRAEEYPPFTAEKQIKLIEFFISSIWWENLKILYKTLDCSLNFENKLAQIVNYLWLSLSEEEKQQIKEILE